MKTDLIEIFQTIRAALQPYTALGFNNRLNTEEKYDLWSEKNVESEGEKRIETFFVSLEIKSDHVAFELQPENLATDETTMKISQLDEIVVNQIEDRVAAGYKIFKEKEWV